MTIDNGFKGKKGKTATSVSGGQQLVESFRLLSGSGSAFAQQQPKETACVATIDQRSATKNQFGSPEKESWTKKTKVKSSDSSLRRGETSEGKGKTVGKKKRERQTSQETCCVGASQRQTSLLL
jgi:hypothetical protein